MSNKLSLVEARLAPGFRFHPTDEELISDYLFNLYSSPHHHLLLQIDLNKCEPWDLPETACVGGNYKEKEWYFYSQRDRKYATGVRKNRATASGYWKATGKDRSIYRKKAVVGMRKTLVFYLGRAPKGNKTDWVMHEFRLQHPPHQDQDQVDDWVLCRVFCKTREIVDDNKKGTHEEEEEELISCCSSHDLPPLMDNNQLSFDNNNKLQQQQVPCFSTPQFEDNNHSSCDNVKSILSRFHHSPCNDQSFLSDAALPVTMWYP